LRQDFKREVRLPGKIVKLSELKKIRNKWKKSGKKMVFTNGCFDLIHLGHIRYLEKAKSFGDYLVIGLNSDSSVKKIKGSNRPIVPEKDRAEILTALWFVDYVVLFKETTPRRLIRELKPDVLVKGADWTIDKIVGADMVLKAGGEVRQIPYVPARSTSEIIQRILKRYGNPKASS